jgi:hypothetical protein
MTTYETRPMAPADLGKYVCVPSGSCLRSPDITIREDGVWVKSSPDGMFSSAHRACFEARTGQAAQAAAPPRPKSHRTVYDRLQATSLTPEWHEKTCGYWYTVTNGATAHTAYATRAGLDRWLAERGLKLENDLPEAGTFGTTAITGAYAAESHGEFLTEDYRDGMGPGDFYSLRPVAATAALSNGDYTLALITEDDGMRTVHTLNPNVKTRVVFDRAAMRGDDRR